MVSGMGERKVVFIMLEMLVHNSHLYLGKLFTISTRNMTIETVLGTFCDIIFRFIVFEGSIQLKCCLFLANSFPSAAPSEKKGCRVPFGLLLQGDTVKG